MAIALVCPKCKNPTRPDLATCVICKTDFAATPPITVRKTGSSSAAVLVVISILVALIGIMSLSNATAGVGALAMACLLAIWARIAQAADYYHKS